MLSPFTTLKLPYSLVGTYSNYLHFTVGQTRVQRWQVNYPESQGVQDPLSTALPPASPALRMLSTRRRLTVTVQELIHHLMDSVEFRLCARDHSMGTAAKKMLSLPQQTRSSAGDRCVYKQ